MASGLQRIQPDRQSRITAINPFMYIHVISDKLVFVLSGLFVNGVCCVSLKQVALCRSPCFVEDGDNRLAILFAHNSMAIAPN